MLLKLWNHPSISHAEAARRVAAHYPGEHPGALRRQLQRKRGHIEKTDERQLLTDVQESKLSACFAGSRHRIGHSRSCRLLPWCEKLPSFLLRGEATIGTSSFFIVMPACYAHTTRSH